MLVANIIIALLSVGVIIAVIQINKLEDEIEIFRKMYWLRVDLQENEKKFNKQEIDNYTYYCNLNQIMAEVKELEDGIEANN